MTIDWAVVATIAAPLLALAGGAALERFLERRPKLVAYLSHVSAFTLRDENGTNLYTHSVVVRNSGKRPATNVRLSHRILPEHYNLYPSAAYRVEHLPEGGAEIVLPSLVPGEQVTIQYLYTPPVTWDQINGPIKYDRGYAKVINVLLQPHYGRWTRIVAGSLMFLGLLTGLYVLWLLISWGLGHL